MTTPAIELRGVGKHYPHFDLADLDLELDSGQVLGLIGANGAGKSTTLRILLGLVRPDRGTVRVLGHAMPGDQIAAKREIGYVSEDLRLYGAATLRWHMEFVRAFHPGWDEPYATELLRRFDLTAEQRIQGLSHGQRVKAALLLAFARRPRLLILDEPTTGLDPVARHEVLAALMEALADEARTVLFSSHNTLDVEQISDRVAFLDRGRLLDLDDKESFLDRWRRLRVALPSGDAVLPPLPGVVSTQRAGRSATVLTRAFAPGLAAAVERAGGQVLAVEPLTLEEIFVANVNHRREEAAA